MADPDENFDEAAKKARAQRGHDLVTLKNAISQLDAAFLTVSQKPEEVADLIASLLGNEFIAAATNSNHPLQLKAAALLERVEAAQQPPNYNYAMPEGPQEEDKHFILGLIAAAVGREDTEDVRMLLESLLLHHSSNLDLNEAFLETAEWLALYDGQAIHAIILCRDAWDKTEKANEPPPIWGKWSGESAIA